MRINFVYDASVANAPAGFKTALGAAAAYLDSLITNPITVTIGVGWGETNGNLMPAGNLATGGPVNGTGLSYSALKAQLSGVATSQADQSVAANLPAIDPTNGGSFFVPSAQEKAWGLVSPAAPGIDGAIGFGSSYAFSFDPNARSQPGLYDFIGIAEHEITHALGRFAGLQYAPGWYSPMDLVRYAAPGQLALSKGEASYFSIDGGQTSLLLFDSSPGGDPGDWASSVPDDPFGYNRTNMLEPMSAVDITMMDVLGYSIAGTPAVGAAAPGTSASVMASGPTTGTSTQGAEAPVAGAAIGTMQSIIPVTPDNLNVVATKPDSFIATGTGNDTIGVSQANGNNVLDGGGGSNVLIGGGGFDTVSVDDRNLAASAGSMAGAFHSGDNLMLRGVTAADFAPTWLDHRAASGSTGLTGVVRAPGAPAVDFTLAGHTIMDPGMWLACGRSQDAPGNWHTVIQAG